LSDYFYVAQLLTSGIFVNLLDARRAEMAKTKAAGTTKCFQWFPPPSKADLKKEREQRGKFSYYEEPPQPVVHAVIIPDDGSAELSFNPAEYMFDSPLEVGDRVSYMVDGDSKLGTEVEKIS
jgi:hypothetical protein